MQPFTMLRGVAAPLPISNIDTDKILPARFLKTVTRDGLGGALFHTLRFDHEGKERSDFILNREPWRNAAILIALENFGCGSSREHAPWALLDFGIRCIIAPSYADIFFNNCFKNGILPVKLDLAIVEELLNFCKQPARAILTIDLGTQTIIGCDGPTITFEIDADRKSALLEGLDEIGRTMRYDESINSYEMKARASNPWISQEGFHIGDWL
jgi:3-isopropylmalate/(R)-2-methylmalate dehydratase small subunit